jgi:class 3 adenylate cyclase/tetratricopeptide (TPR) repeat protein
VRETSQWLEKLGMSEYAERFAENHIDLALLGDLTDQDLEKIGVASLGHRRRLLRAIAELGSVEEVASKSAPASALAEPSQDAAERRQVTVMFSDLVGSTALSVRMDPEDLREVISAYHKCVAETVRRFDGFVAKYMGDGVLVYFGYPQAHEDDAERAVRAGLELIAAVGALKTPVRLQTRVGIATGLVVVGDLIGSGEAQERGIVGETPNLAARLQSTAEPNMVVVAEGTRKLLGNLFELEDLGARELKGIAGLVRAWAALRAITVESRFEAMHATDLTVLVGREEEFELLLRRWSRAKSGEGQVALLSGEAGIGKSRLTAAMLERLVSEPHTRLRYFCSPQHTDSTLYPIIAQLERAAGVARDDTPQAKLNKLDAMLAQTSTSIQDTALFAEMLSLPNDGRYPASELTPQQRRQRTMEALVAQLEALARQNPVLMIFEDAHWTDPTSLEAFGRVVDRIRDLRVLLIVTFRPEFEPPWIGQPHVTMLTINRLPEREVGAMIDRLVGNKMLAGSIRQDLIERTDGIPLFIEEMTKAVLEAEGEGEAQRTVAAVPSPTRAIPASLHASLMARLDRLGPAKELGQIGAAIGREFSHALLAAVARKPDRELASALDSLHRAGLLFRQGVPPHASYLFKHALVQDAAYGTLLRGRRQELHSRIALTLRDSFSDITQAQPEILAHHFEHAGMTREAIDFWIKAGGLTRQRSANAEAAAHFNRALKLIPELTEHEESSKKELAIQFNLGQIYMATKGYGSIEAEAAYKRASDLCDKIGDRELLLRVLVGLRTLNQIQGKLDKAREFGTQCLQSARAKNDRIYIAQASVGLGHTLCFMGNFIEARSHLVEAINAYDPAHYAQHVAISGWTPQILSMTTSGWNEWLLGYPDRALESAKGAIEVALQARYPQSVDHAHSSCAHTHLLRRETDSAFELIDSALAICREHGFHMRLAMLRVLTGWALAQKGDCERAIWEISSGIQDYRKTGANSSSSNYFAIMSAAYHGAGMIAEGLQTIAQVRELPLLHEEHWWDAELHRIEGDLRLALEGPQSKSAEQCYLGAISTARRQQAKSWELRASTSLARLLSEKGRRAEARDLLTPIYAWFTEGFDTRDLKEAKSLLGMLAS